MKDLKDMTTEELNELYKRVVEQLPRFSTGPARGVMTNLETGMKFGYDSTKDKWHNIWAIDENGNEIYFMAKQQPTMTYREAYEALKKKREAHGSRFKTRYP